jgi:hypothetical protein
MTRETSPYPETPPPPPLAPRTGWSSSDLVIGGSLVVLLIAIFLPWFSSTVRLVGGTASVSGSADGPHAHGYLWAVLVLAIAGLIVLIARDAIYSSPGNLPSPEQIMVGATGLTLLLTILGLVLRPSSGLTIARPSAQISAILPILPHLSISVGWSYGGFIAVAAALVAFIAAFGEAGPLQSARRLAQARLRRPSTTA